MAEESDLKEAGKNIVHQYTEKAIEPLLKYFLSARPLKAMFRDLSIENIELVDSIVPGIGALAAAKVPDLHFISPGASAFVKNVVLEVSKSVGRVLRDNKNATENDLAEAATAAVKEVEEMLVTLDQFGHFHLPDCVTMAGAQYGRRSKNNNQGPPWNQVKFKDAVDQGRLPGTCCYKRVEEAKQAQKDVGAKNASADRRGLSPLEVIGSDEVLGKALIEWLDSLPADQKPRVMAQLEYLDSHNELVGLMACSEELRIAMLPALENRDARVAVKKWFSRIGDIVEKTFDFGMSLVSTTARQIEEWDATYAEPAAQVKAERKVPVATRVARNKEARAAAREARRARKPWYVRMFL